MVRARRVACFLSEQEKIEYHMTSLPVDRYADFVPVPLEVSSGVAAELSLLRKSPTHRSGGARSKQGFTAALADEFFKGVGMFLFFNACLLRQSALTAKTGNRHTIRKRPLSEMKIAYEIGLREFHIKVVDTVNRGKVRTFSLFFLPVFFVCYC